MSNSTILTANGDISEHYFSGEPGAQLKATGVGVGRPSTLDVLEAEASFILLEAAAAPELTPGALLFSAGKDSACIAHLLKKTFTNTLGQCNIPFSFFHYDSGDNFPEVLAYRDAIAKQLGVPLTTLNVVEASRSGLLSTTLDGQGNVLALVELVNYSQRHYGLKVMIGGGRRDEDPVRAKERIFSVRLEDASWNPTNQRPEIWNLYNTALLPGAHLRVFPISNWTERSVWEYIARDNVPLPSIYYAHERPVFRRNGNLLAYFPDIELRPGEQVEIKSVRCRTVGDRKTTGFIESVAKEPWQVYREVCESVYSERYGRVEDVADGTGMEERKGKGGF